LLLRQYISAQYSVGVSLGCARAFAPALALCYFFFDLWFFFFPEVLFLFLCECCSGGGPKAERNIDLRVVAVASSGKMLLSNE